MTPSTPAAIAADRDVLLLVSSGASREREELARRFNDSDAIDARSLQLGTSAADALAEILADRPSRVVAVPLSFLANDSTVQELDGLLRWAKTRWPDATFLRSDPLGSADHALGWASRRAREALAMGRSDSAPSGGSALLVVGEGGEPAANAEVCAFARILWENLDLDLFETAFVQTARPTIAEALGRLPRLGVERILVVSLSLLADATYRETIAQVESARTAGVVIAEPLLAQAAAFGVARRRVEEAVDRWALWGDDGLSAAHGHSHDHGIDPLQAGDDILPPRYRGGQAVNSASMGTASLIYDDDGRVAWDRIWQSFCNLALAGGPPHRGSLLEPPTRDEALADPDGSAQVAEEIARGLAMITRLPIVADATPGWVGLVCPDEEMAIWMLRAIVVENVCVRREGATLFLPAGPDFRVEKEIKNVITAVAKTHHYWTEHRAAR